MERSETPSNSFKAVAVTVRTVDGSVVQGKINLGFERRVSDLFTKSRSPFVVVFDAVYSGGVGKTLVINKTHIVWIEPEEARIELMSDVGPIE